MHTSKVSLCIPSYNVPYKLERVLSSILKQSYKNFEVIVTDDSECDEIQEVVERFQESFTIIYKKNLPKKGTPENWNYAISLASGDYIKLMHYDDWFINESSLQNFVELLDQNPNSSFGFCQSIDCQPNGKIIKAHAPSDIEIKKLKTDPRNLFYKNIIGSPSTTIFRSEIKDGFNNKLKWVVDVDFYISVLLKNSSFAYCSLPLVFINCDDASQVTHFIQYDKEVQIFEWTYLDSKIFNNEPANFQRLFFFWTLFLRYSINSADDLKLLLYGIEFNNQIASILDIIKIYKRINKIFSHFFFLTLYPYLRIKNLLKNSPKTTSDK